MGQKETTWMVHGAIEAAVLRLGELPVTIIAHSLGSAVGLRLAASTKAKYVDSLILSSPFTSVPDMVRLSFILLGQTEAIEDRL